MAIFVSQTNIDKYMAVHRDDSERFRRLSILGRIGWWEADFSSRQYAGWYIEGFRSVAARRDAEEGGCEAGFAKSERFTLSADLNIPFPIPLPERRGYKCGHLRHTERYS